MTERNVNKREQKLGTDQVSETELLERLTPGKCFPLMGGDMQGSEINARKLTVLGYPIPAIDILLGEFDPQEHMDEMKQTSTGELHVRFPSGWHWASERGMRHIQSTPNGVVIVTDTEEIPASVIRVSDLDNSRHFLVRNKSTQ